MTWTTRQRSEFGDLSAIFAGSGDPVLLLHGVGLRAEAWNAQIDALSQHHTVIAPDMPGHGETSRFDFEPDLSDFTDRLVDALETPVHIVGHSMGAMIALDLAAEFPGLVSSVTALNAIFQRPPKAANITKIRAAGLDGLTVGDPAPTLERWFGGTASPQRQACQDWLTSVDPEGYGHAYGVFAAEDGPTPDALGRITCPALFMTGADEPNSTPAMSRAMAEIAPKGDAIIVDGAAHMMPMTHSGAVNAALMKHFKGV